MQEAPLKNLNNSKEHINQNYHFALLYFVIILLRYATQCGEFCYSLIAAVFSLHNSRQQSIYRWIFTLLSARALILPSSRCCFAEQKITFFKLCGAAYFEMAFIFQHSSSISPRAFRIPIFSETDIFSAVFASREKSQSVCSAGLFYSHGRFSNTMM